jgi:hypothetical protein
MFSLTRVLHAPKDGNSDEQYEDAYAASAPLGDPVESLTLAVADGASSAVFAREWARLLADAFARPEAFPAGDHALFERAAALGAKWRGQVTDKATSWYAQERLPGGSSAALLVAVFDVPSRDAGPRLRAVSVGDVSLFVVREGRLKYGFPKTRSRQYDDRPALLTTAEPEAEKPRPAVLRFETALQPGDRCFVASDALACWFLQEHEARRRPWEGIPAEPEEFAPWLKRLRESGAMKNDDVTLLTVGT